MKNVRKMNLKAKVILFIIILLGIVVSCSSQTLPNREPSFYLTSCDVDVMTIVKKGSIDDFTVTQWYFSKYSIKKKGEKDTVFKKVSDCTLMYNMNINDSTQIYHFVTKTGKYNYSLYYNSNEDKVFGICFEPKAKSKALLYNVLESDIDIRKNP